MIISRTGVILGNMGLANMTVYFTLVTGLSNSIFFVHIPGLPVIFNHAITIAAAIFQIILCIGILKLKIRAFKIYAGLIAVRCAIQIISVSGAIIASSALYFTPATVFYTALPFILKGILLFIIYIIDGKHFGGFAINEPASAIMARKRSVK